MYMVTAIHIIYAINVINYVINASVPSGLHRAIISHLATPLTPHPSVLQE